MDHILKGYELTMLNRHQATGDKGLKDFPSSSNLIQHRDLNESEHTSITVVIVELGCIGFPLALSLSNKSSIVGFDTNS